MHRTNILSQNAKLDGGSEEKISWSGAKKEKRVISQNLTVREKGKTLASFSKKQNRNRK